MLAVPDKIAAASRLEELGCDYIIHHIGYDERRGLVAAGKPCPSPLDELRAIVEVVRIPVQAVGGLSIEQAMSTPEFGAPLVVLGAPLIISANVFKTTTGENLQDVLKTICDRVHAYGDVGPAERT